MDIKVVEEFCRQMDIPECSEIYNSECIYNIGTNCNCNKSHYTFCPFRSPLYPQSVCKKYEPSYGYVAVNNDKVISRVMRTTAEVLDWVDRCNLYRVTVMPMASLLLMYKINYTLRFSKDAKYTSNFTPPED